MARREAQLARSDALGTTASGASRIQNDTRGRLISGQINVSKVPYAYDRPQRVV